MIHLTTLSLIGCLAPWPEEAAPEDVVAGFVYIGPLLDHGWTKSHDEGRLFLEDELGVDTVYRETVNPADALAVIDDMVASDGANVVFTTSFDYQTAALQSAANYPERYFLNCSGDAHADNLTSYMGRMYQPLYLAGYLAAKQSCTGRLGVVASVPIPEVVRHINAFTLGARRANPDAVVDVRWVMDWFDSELEPRYTRELAEHGADVILTQTDTSIPVEEVKDLTATCHGDPSPVYSIGYDNIDTCSHAPDRCLTAAYWNWGPMYVDYVQSILDGAWEPEPIRWDPMQNDDDSVVAMADISAELVDSTVRLEIPQIRDELLAAEGPFVGPLTDSAGTPRLEPGDRLDDLELNRMCWHVDGVIRSDGGSDEPATVPPGCAGDY